jgi:hypothetical protein
MVRDHGGCLDVTGPTAYGPGRLLDLAVEFGWLPPPFRSSRPTGQVV